METEKKTIIKNAIGRKEMQKTISDQLHTDLPILKEQLGEKKFEKRIKKASKMLVSGMKKISKKELGVGAKKPIPDRKKAVKIPSSE